MSYSPVYQRLYNFSNDDSRGLESPAPTKLDAELDGISASLAGLRSTIVSITTADQKLKPSQPVNASEVQVRDPDEFTATAGQTVFSYTGGVIDTDQTFVKVYVAGARLATDDYTVATDKVTLDTGAALDDVVIVEFYDVQDYALTQLADYSDPDLGAGLVGYNDQNGYAADLPITGTPTNINDALDLVQQNIVGIGEDFYPLSQWIKSDGSQELLADWDVGGTYRISNHPASTASGEVVVHQQLQSVISSLSTLSASFVAVDGSSTMAGDLDLGGNKIVSLATATGSGDAVEFDQFEAGLALKLEIDGSNAMTGDLDLGANKAVNMADGTNTTDGATYGQVLSAIGVPIYTKREYATYNSGTSGAITDLGSGKKRFTAPALIEGTVMVIGLGGGAGGAGGAQGALAGAAGTAGGDTLLHLGANTYILAKGGAGGDCGIDVDSNGGAGGSAGGATVPGVIAYAGDDGADVSANIGTGGAGGDVPLVQFGKIPDMPYLDGDGGTGGAASAATSHGVAGQDYGSGGGGGGTEGSGDNGGAGGGAGAVGIAFVSLAAGEYFDFTVGSGGAGGNSADDEAGGGTAYTAPGNDGANGGAGEGGGGGSGAAGVVYVYYKLTATVNEV